VTTRIVIGAAILVIVAVGGLCLLWRGVADRRRRRRWAKKTDYIYIDASHRETRAPAD
jgi:hypothetical protein